MYHIYIKNEFYDIDWHYLKTCEDFMDAEMEQFNILATYEYTAKVVKDK